MPKTLIKVDFKTPPEKQPQLHNRWHPDIPMVAWVKPGDEFRVECVDWTGGQIHDDDNAMNVGEFLPVTATFSACLQNNHHHYPGLLRLSHEKSEYDFGFLTVKVMKSLGLVKASSTGALVPKDVPLEALDF